MADIGLRMIKYNRIFTEIPICKNIRLFFNDDERHWDISYNLGKNFWGNGYVTEAMRAVIKYAAEVMKIKEISTAYAVENQASGRVLQKLGFRFVKEIPYECNGGDIITTGRYCRYKM